MAGTSGALGSSARDRFVATRSSGVGIGIPTRPANKCEIAAARP
jgi:hypothetical protein